jgi:hypothetical protein
MNAVESSNQLFLSKSTARKKHVSSREHGVDAGHEGLAGVVTAREVPADYFIGHRQELTVGALRALMRGFSQMPRSHSLAHAGA